MTEMRGQLVAEARRLEEDCKFTEKTHFVAWRGWTSLHYLLGLPAAILAAVVSAAAFSAWDSTGVTTGWLSIIIVALTALMTFLNPKEKGYSHHSNGCDYNALRGKVRRFHSIDCLNDSDKSDSDLNGNLDAIARTKAELDKQPPPAPTWAYLFARKGIVGGQADYASDETGTGT